MSFVFIITYNIKDQIEIRWMFVVAVANDVFKINCTKISLLYPTSVTEL